jgi:hypothetical protein
LASDIRYHGIDVGEYLDRPPELSANSIRHWPRIE